VHAPGYLSRKTVLGVMANKVHYLPCGLAAVSFVTIVGGLMRRLARHMLCGSGVVADVVC
jgi:hypothetical protein